MEKKLLKIISDVFEIKEADIKMELTKENISNWDSLKHMDLIVSIENEFNITLDIDDIINLNSVGDAFSIVERKL